MLDGIPMLDRGEIRESLSQVDVNMIDRIEIVEGPMSVSYGTDALGGVVNIITKKAALANQLSVRLRIQEETAGKEYSGFGAKGAHNQSLNVNYNKQAWTVSGSLSQNDFGGWKGQARGRTLDWNPKDQLMGGFKLGYNRPTYSLWYRLDAVGETITLYGQANESKNVATDKDYITRRFFHQAQFDWTPGNGLRMNTSVAYTDYSRRTRTTILNTQSGDRRLSPEPGEQDKSVFDHAFLRTTVQYTLNDRVSFQPGVEINLNGSSGDRISGSPVINDYAFFVSSELKIAGANIRPGVRLIRNSVYDAPPAIPSLNALIPISGSVDMRLSYARGFRAPSLRELYFDFFDSSHSVRGNTALKAEYSNSYNGSLSWRRAVSDRQVLEVTLSGFHNDFRNMIDMGFSPEDQSVSTYINIGRSKTTGSGVQTSLRGSKIKSSVGFSWIGRYNRISEDIEFGSEVPQLTWSPELNANFLYNLEGAGASLVFAYKFNGRLPAYQILQEADQRRLLPVRTDACHLADLTVNKEVWKQAIISLGVKNLFNITRINNTATNTGSAHSTNGPVPVSYGRSFLLGLTYNWTKKLNDQQ
ncbi:TonB-dependent receptor plug domain-containing protein [Arcticibacter sp. MXS-1]|uniref:TonB-dependent receptor plug domain-containing protein n=1 Tax=Arcticibacter sp. MXS-1 TaxID=3341726 RepID=UPI0035A97D7B